MPVVTAILAELKTKYEGNAYDGYLRRLRAGEGTERGQRSPTVIYPQDVRNTFAGPPHADRDRQFGSIGRRL